MKIRTFPRYAYRRKPQRAEHLKLVPLSLRHAMRACFGRRWKRWANANTAYRRASRFVSRGAGVVVTGPGGGGAGGVSATGVTESSLGAR